jgi:hypothetical protein
VAPNAFGKVRRIQKGSIGHLYAANPGQAFEELLPSVFAEVREANLLLQPRAYGVAIDDEAELTYLWIEDLIRELAGHHARGRQPALIGERAKRVEP